MTQFELNGYITNVSRDAGPATSPVWAVYQPDTNYYGWMSHAFTSLAQARAYAFAYGRRACAVVCVEEGDHTKDRVRIAPLLRQTGY
jgi:hypothetical protein